ncbi:uncharacterized protein DFL_007025 [Arthrobotrys flagrans]|uniref:DUF6594 domain-containing protein n=1 Tax=Arthrobotrys flagrans TaxID=97331 RepID=A0A436ZV25_ARTFL|nr:hypothetical protein DFL_007025 [Arthrobotrys flagrans]
MTSLESGTSTLSWTDNGNPDALQDLEKGPKETLRDIPLGYSYVAAYADGNEAAPVFRRFGALDARVLYTQQAELEQIERELAIIDEDESNENIEDTDNKTWLKDRNPKRKELMAEAAEKLPRYKENLILYRQMRHLPTAKKWQKKNFGVMLYNTASICPLEAGFIEKDDLVSMMKESDDVAELSEWVTDFRRRIVPNFGLKQLFKKSKKSVYDGSDEITIYSQKWMRIVGRTFFGMLVAAVVTSGVILLHFVHVDKWRLIILGLSTLVCAVLTAVFTTAKKSEVFAVAAAYCAVLVVFVGTTLEKNGQVTLQLGDTWINGTVSG